MPARVILIALATVALAMTVHIAWWRMKRPAADIAAIFRIFLVVPTVAYGVLAVGGWLRLLPISPEEALLSLVLHTALSCAYVQTYPAVQAQSPTLTILLAVGSASEGLTGAGIVRSLDANGLVAERATDLLRNGLLVRQGSRIRPSRIGHLMALAFGAYRRWLGLSRLGG
jgi:hypothetical protein